jgi:hypothetical protein
LIKRLAFLIIKKKMFLNLRPVVESTINDLNKDYDKLMETTMKRMGEIEISIDGIITDIHDFNVNTEENICHINSNLAK